MKFSELSRRGPPGGKHTFQSWIVVGSSQVSIETVPVIWPSEGEVLVRVRAFGVCDADVLQLDGSSTANEKASNGLGLEFSGEVVSVGRNVSSVNEGDHVCCFVYGGGCSELCLCPQEFCIPKPKDYSWEEAAALPVAFLTASISLFELSSLKAGDTVMIHNGSDGICHLMIQMARARGVRVFTTSSTQEDAEFCKSLGADVAHVRCGFSYLESVLEFSWRGVNAVVDCLGGKHMTSNLMALEPGGTLVHTAWQDAVVDMDLRVLIERQLRVCGCSLRGMAAGALGGAA
eukprot:CAMPEP_0113694572 /NCGR_PEP_ID=MMETSP0038_2-20120614/20374_1 /TAXON_ID=2898 /ORGANISM="Cryptomonas paramecium" /LENGTH=288 /DNA_ID=CAMNT_0000616929 /DNA_START=872 /DNA_END=1735 /DNA_ORIENTATION=- /assembly_acc=CAM_ASM_000170